MTAVVGCVDMTVGSAISWDGVDFSGCFCSKEYTETYIPKQVIFNGNVTVVIWQDNSKTIVRCSDDEKFSEEVGFAEALAKKVFGSRSAFLKIVENAYRQPENKVKKKEDNA
jgi:hypothetical protein